MSTHDYQRIEAAIRYLAEQRTCQPGLSQLADHLDLSPAYLQRLFRRWAGVSPKQFLQYLTVEHAKTLLADSRSVLDTTYEVGLSSPARLHDHFVTVLAMTPGEYKASGADLAIQYGFHPTPFGECLLATTRRGICWLSFVDEDQRSAALEELRAAWPRSELCEDNRDAMLAQQLFQLEPRADRPLTLLLKGTNFQLQVWQALLRVPPGTLVTYGDVAAAVDRPSAARAVGSAVGANQIAWLVPCHRVLREHGVSGQYRWGSHRKQAMIGWESAQTAAEETVAGR